MPFLDKATFQQKLRDGDAMGIPREVTYQTLKQKYQIEGDPGEKPSVQKSGGVMGYLGETVQGAARELGGILKFGVHYATNPQDIIPDAANTAIDTVSSIQKGLVGGAENLGTMAGEGLRSLAGKQPANRPLSEEQQTANAIGQGVKSVASDPLGTFKNHPLATLSTLAPVGGGALKAAGFAKAGKVVGALDPLNAAVKTVTKGPALAGKYGKEVLGLTTGAGGGATDVAAAAKGADSAFFQGMRGDPLEQAKLLITDSQKGLSVVKAQRSAAYKKTNEALKSIMEPLSDKPVKSILNKTMKDFNITDKEMGLLDTMKGMTDEQAANHLQSIMTTSNGELSPLVKAGIGEGPTASKIGKAIHYVQNWDDYTPDGLDRLQKSLSSIDPKPGSPESSFITTMKKGVQNVVKEKYPEYSKMLDDYHTASDQIDEMQTAIGSNNRASIETAVRKMSQSMKTGNQGFEIRNAIISQLQEITGLPIKERIAGMAMNQAVPRGLAGVASGVGAMGVMAQMISPSFLVGLAMSSPRVVGEILGALGVGKNYVVPVIEKLREAMPFQIPDATNALRTGAAITQTNE